MSINVFNVVNQLAPDLHASGSSNLEFWSQTEPYDVANQAAAELARHAAVNMALVSLPLTSGVGTYTLPTSILSIVEVYVAGQTARAYTPEELLAFGAVAPKVVGWSPVGDTQIQIVPVPDATQAAGGATILAHVKPQDATLGGADSGLPAILEVWLRYRVLMRLRSQETPGAMPEVAGVLAQFCGLWEQACLAYYGPVR